eukprot:6204033-Pleurochrysis_carterae.AAC.4
MVRSRRQVGLQVAAGEIALATGQLGAQPPFALQLQVQERATKSKMAWTKLAAAMSSVDWQEAGAAGAKLEQWAVFEVSLTAGRRGQVVEVVAARLLSGPCRHSWKMGLVWLLPHLTSEDSSQYSRIPLLRRPHK